MGSREIVSPRVVIFSPSINHCEHLATLIPGAEAIHSRLSRREQADRLRTFREGSLATVITVDKFNEGIDVPEANVIVFLRSTASRAIFFQQLGRGLRLSDDKKQVLVLDFVASCDRLIMLEELRRGVNDRLTGIRDGKASSPLQIDSGTFEFDEVVRNVLKVIQAIRTGYTKEMLTEQLLAKAVDGVMPSIPTVNADPEMAPRSAFVRVFNTTWNGIAKEVGLKHNKADYSKDDLKAQLLAKAVDGVMPSSLEVNADPNMAAAGTFTNVFGANWTDIAKELGLRSRHTKDSLKAQLLAKSVNGIMPSAPAVGADPEMASPGTFTRVFTATWNEIAKEIGLTPRRPGGQRQ